MGKKTQNRIDSMSALAGLGVHLLINMEEIATDTSNALIQGSHSNDDRAVSNWDELVTGSRSMLLEMKKLRDFIERMK